MLLKPNLTDVLWGDLWAGTHITINYQLSNEIKHISQNWYGIVKAGASRTFNKHVKSEHYLVALVVKPKEC